MYIGVMVVRRTDLPDGHMSLVAFARVTEKIKKQHKAGWKSLHKTICTLQSEPAPGNTYDQVKATVIKSLRDMLLEQGLGKDQITNAEGVVWEI